MTSKFEKIKYLLYNMKWDLLCWGIIMDLKENERIDDLEYKGLKIIQNENYFCFGMDSILLSDFAKDLKKDSNILDIGTGTGIISILLSKKTECKKIFALEVQKEISEMAGRSVKLNDLENTIEIIKMQ